MSTHRIHLRGPWEVTFPYAGESRPQRHVLPCDWESLFGTQAGTACFERAFHCPTNLELQTAVFLVIEDACGVGEVWVNSECLGELRPETPLPFRIDIRPRLLPRNRLKIVVSFDPARMTAPQGLYCVVALDIVEPESPSVSDRD